MNARALVGGVLVLSALVVWAAGSGPTDPDYPAGVRLPVANDDITFHASFDYGDALPDRAVNPNGVRIKGKPQFAPGVRGQALVMGPKGVGVGYPLAGNLDLGRPGAITIWVRPVDWQYGSDEPIVRFWSTSYSGAGYIGLQRQGRIVKNGLLRRQAALHCFIHYFKGVGNATFGVGGHRLANGRWHLLVLQWRGRQFEGWLDEGPPRAIELRRPLRTEEPTGPLEVGGGSGWTTLLDELTIYRRPLSASEIAEIYRRGASRH